MSANRALRSIITLAAALGLSGLIAYAQIAAYRAHGSSVQQVAGSPIGGPFTLVDQHGKPFTDRDLAGHYALIYFGYTFCPAVCPMELQTMTIALKTLGASGNAILPVFITVDPARDTQSVMANYVPQFSPRLIGLTGTQAQIDTVLKDYHVYARKAIDPKMSDYTVDHSSYIYFIGPDGVLLDTFGAGSKPDEIVAAVKRSLK